MKVAIYGDAHITRKMGSIQDVWNESVVSIFRYLYEEFTSRNVKMAVCLGDLFDKAILEAKSVKLVLEVLSILNNSTFPTYVLLGNHEIDSQEHNILDYLSEYDNIIPITTLTCIEDKFTFIPYSVSIEDVPEEYIKYKYVFTHHDIYGSELASGKLRASFGIDPNLLSSAKWVFNGHIHLDSRLGNIINVGSITKMQQGELRLYETPGYYYLYTDTSEISSYSLREHFIAYLTVSPNTIESLYKYYEDSVKFSLRLQYDDDIDQSLLDKYKSDPRILNLSLRKSVSQNIDSNSDTKKHTLDIKEFLSEYIRRDETVMDSEKNDMIELGVSLLEVGA